MIITAPRRPLTAHEAIDAFRGAMLDAGVVPRDGLNIISDGEIHRFVPEGVRGHDKCGWYVFYGSHGAFGDFRMGGSTCWSSAPVERKDPVRLGLLNKMSAVKAQREVEEREKAQALAQEILDASAFGLTPYLIRKGIKSAAVGFMEAERLREYTPLHQEMSGLITLIPMCTIDNEVRSLQFIDANGMKRMLSGGGKAGLMFTFPGYTDVIVIAEGFATAASISSCLDSRIVCAFDAGNLLPVGRAVRERHPERRIVFAADNDAYTTINGKHVNVGYVKACAAADAVGGVVVMPTFKNPRQGLSDFNDLMLEEGREEVVRQLSGAM